MGMICGSPARPGTETNKKNNNKDINSTNDKPFQRNNVVIAFSKGKTEEYQNFNPLQGKVKYGSLFPDSPEHPLIMNKYFLVADREVDMDGRCLNQQQKCHQKLSHANVYGMCQPNKAELKSLLDSFQNQNSAILLVNLREESVLFLSSDDLSPNTTVPYSIRDKDNRHQCIVNGLTPKLASRNEIILRREIMNHSAMEQRGQFCFYNSLSNANKEPHKYRILCEDNILTSDEVYHQFQFEYQNLKVERLCFPLNGALTEQQFDDFINLVKMDFIDGRCKIQMNTIFICNNGQERSTLALIMSGLIYGHTYGFPHEVSSSPYKINSKKPNYELGEFNVIRMLIAQLADGLIVKHQVDLMINECNSNWNLRHEIFKAKTDFDKLSIAEQHTKEGKAKRKLVRDRLETYYYLICFNAYLAEQVKHNFHMSFSAWMLERPTLYRLQSFLDVTAQKGNELLQSSLLVLDNPIEGDYLCSVCNVGAANFHRMEGLPLFGMAHPTPGVFEKLIENLTKTKKFSHVFFINLRNNLSFFNKGELYHLSYKSETMSPRLHHPDDTHFDDLESSLAAAMKKASVMLIKDSKKEPVKEDLSQVMTTKEMFQMEEEKYHCTGYFRVPLPSDFATNENAFDDLMGMFNEVKTRFRSSISDTKSIRSSTDSRSSWGSSGLTPMAGMDIIFRRSSTSQSKSPSNEPETTFNPAYCFFCSNGVERSTFAMAASALFMYDKSGYPPGTRPGEQERVSINDAEFTMGKFIAVKRIIMILPDGWSVKREVDFVLDQLFETMSTAHFHLREMILVTYNRAQKSESVKEQKELYMESLTLLERYIYLLLYNGYLHTEKKPRRKTFRQWMEKDCKRVGVYKILNDLEFVELQDKPCGQSTIRERWRDLYKLEDGEFL